MASEEEKDMIMIPAEYPKGDYVVMFDPLDGSTNIDVDVSIGTIFGIFHRITPGGDGTLEDCLQPGRKLFGAGYIIYSSSTILVYSTGHGVNGFSLDPSVGEFVLSHPNITMPKRGKIYSANEGNYPYWKQGTREYIEYLKSERNTRKGPYTSRYIGSLVADFHRNLLKGGIFLYPEDTKDPKKPTGKLRILYEANPLAFIAEQAGLRVHRLRAHPRHPAHRPAPAWCRSSSGPGTTCWNTSSMRRGIDRGSYTPYPTERGGTVWHKGKISRRHSRSGGRRTSPGCFRTPGPSS